MTNTSSVPGIALRWIDAASRAAGYDLAGRGAPGRDVDEPIARGALLEAVGLAGGVDASLVAAAKAQPDDLGMVAFALLARPTVGLGFASLGRYLRLFEPSAALKIRVQGDVAHVELTYAEARDDALIRAGIVFLWAYSSGAIRDASRSELRPQGVQFRHAAPSNIEAYRSAFGCPVAFHCDVDALVLPARALDQRLTPGDFAVGARLRNAAGGTLRALPGVGATSTQVRDVIFDELLGGIPHMTRVAARLGMSVPSLSAVLKSEGSTFAGLREELLDRLARNLLDEHSLSIVDVAFTLGFIDLDVFRRTFERWSGLSPAAFRSAPR